MSDLESFLKSIEQRAYRMALTSCGHRDDALDMVQDAMLKFVDKYASKPKDQWKPLFYRMLHNRITDHYRKRATRGKWHAFLSAPFGNEEADPFQAVEDTGARDPADAAKVNDAFGALESALAALPLRQQQAFLLRAWEEMSVKETALSMGCTEGSVKTHYFRALNTLREQLGDHWP